MVDNRMIGGVIIGIIGLFYTVLPHSVHIASKLAFGLNHLVHIMLGIVLIIVAAMLMWYKKH